MIHTGDCLDVMAQMDAESIDAVVTDPPYGLEFMGKEWDRLGAGFTKGGSARFANSPPLPSFGRTSAGAMQQWHQRWAEAAYRVAKPSAYLLAFGGTRTVHRLTVALEDAGWIIRDMLVWAYASGFPKSKASLKPAWEPIVMARKPGPLRMLAIDECRIPTDENLNGGAYAIDGTARDDGYGMQRTGGAGEYEQPSGRWPANVILTDPIFDGGWDGVVGGGDQRTHPGTMRTDSAIGGYHGTPSRPAGTVLSLEDSGTYSRFFLIPKADRSDREPVLTPEWYEGTGRANGHPTVKPTDLMRHLVRLVTPAGGTVLDPFLGSGTTGLACEMEGFAWVGIEKEPEYVAIAEARLNGTQRGLGLVG